MSQDFNLGITTSMDINNPLKQLDELENRLKQITNNINQLDRASDKAEKGTKNYGKESKELTDKFNKQEKTIKKLEQQLSKFNNEKKKSTTATKENKDATDNWLSSHSKSLQLAVESITIWGLATQAVYGTKRAFDEMVQTIKEVNTEMVSLQKVMNPAITDFQEMKNVASELGVEYAKSTQEVVRSMVDWGRQGKRQNEVIKLTEASLLAANVAEMEAADSVRYLTAATLQFNVDASDATEIVDKWNEVSNNFATTATDLAESIKEAGAAANNAGIAMDDLIGMTTALTASTAKSGNRIGNSLKTMFSRIRGDMGSESTEILGQVEKSLNDIGIALRVNQDTYRDTTNVLSDLALQWDSLDEVMRDNIARAIGGRRRYSDVISLMENWDIATDATRTSMNSLNSAVEENETYMESIEAQWNQAIQAGNKLSLTIGEAGMNDAIIKFSNTLESTFGFMENFVLGLTKMDQSVKALLGAGASGGIIILISKVGLLSKAFTALITSINPVVAGIGALVGITVTAISKWGEYQTRLENGKETYEEINEALERNNELSSTEVSQIDEKISKYLELTDTYDIAAEKINELYKNAPSEEEVLSAMFTEDNEKQLEKGRKNIEEMDKLGKEQKETIKELRAVFQDMSKQYSNDDNFLNAVKDDLFEYQQTLHNSISYIADFSKDHWKMLQQHRQENHLLQEKAETYNELMQKEKLSYVEQIRLKGVMDDLENSYVELIGSGDNFGKVLDNIRDKSQMKYGLGGTEITKAIATFEEEMDTLSNGLEELEQKRKVYAEEIQRIEKVLNEVDKSANYETWRDLNLELFKYQDELKNVDSQMVKASQSFKEHQEWIKSLKKEYGETDDIGFFINKIEKVKSAIDSLRDSFMDTVSKLSGIEDKLDIDLEVLDVFSRIRGSSKNDIFEDRIKIYEQSIKSLESVYGELLTLIKNIDNFDEYIANVKKEIGYKDMTRKERLDIDNILGELDKDATKNEIETKMIEITEILASTWQEKINDIKFDIELSELMNIDISDRNKMADSEVDAYIKAIEEKLKSSDISDSEGRTLSDMLGLFENEQDFRTQEEQLNNIFKTLSSIANIPSHKMPIFTDKASQNAEKLNEELKNINKNMLGSMPTSSSGLQSYIEQMTEFMNMIPYLNTMNPDIDLTEIFNLAEFNKQIIIAKRELEELMLSDIAQSNFEKTFDEYDKLATQFITAQEQLMGMTNDADRMKQQAYIDYLIKQMEELEEKNIHAASTDNLFDHLNSSLEKTQKLLDDIDIDELTVSQSERMINNLEDELRKVQEKILLIYGNQDSMTNDEFMNQLEQYGLSAKQIKEVMKLLNENIKDTEVSWYEAISGGLLNAFASFDEFDSFSDKLIKSIESVTSEIWNNDDLKKEMKELFGTFGEYIDESFDLDIKANIESGLSGAMESLSKGKSLGRSLLGGIGNFILPGIGGMVGDFVGGLGEMFVGADSGEKTRDQAQKVNEQNEQLINQLKEFGIVGKATKATWKDTANWFENMFGKDEWEVFNLDGAEKDMDRLTKMIERVQQTFNSVSSGLVNAIKNSFDYNELKATFDQSVGQALQDAVITKLIETKAIEKQIKQFAGEVEKALVDGITESEMNRLNNLRDNISQQGEEIRQVLADLGLDAGGLEMDNSISNNFSAGSSSNYTFNSTYVVRSEYFGGSQEEAEEFVRNISDLLIEELERRGYAMS